MRHILLLLFAVIAITSCEKAVLPDDGKEKNNTIEHVVIVDSTEKTPTPTDTTSHGEAASGDSVGHGDEGDGILENFISVDSAINLPNATSVVVKGYIVGSCSRSISNALFTVPTTYSQSVLVADKDGETNIGHVLAVCLTDRTVARKNLNLQDNPSNLHRLVIFDGTRVKYLGIPGVKGVNNYKIVNK
jgi:hypothetical protein